MNQPHKPLSIFVLNTYWLRFYSGLRHKGGLLPRALQILSKAAWNREVGLFISSERETSYCDDTNTKEVERTSNRNISNSLFWSWAFDIIGRRQSVEQMVCKHGRPQSSRLVDENVPPPQFPSPFLVTGGAHVRCFGSCYSVLLWKVSP